MRTPPLSHDSDSPRIIDVGEPCRGNTGLWGRTVTYEVDTPLGPMPMVDWENLLDPEADGGDRTP